MTNVIQLPRPQALRTVAPRLGHYLRVGRNEHKEVAHLLAEGERRYSGIVIDGHLRGQHACRDSQCCPKGQRDMLEHPVRHYLRQRAREVASIGEVPRAGRVQFLMDNFIRSRSDAMAALAAAGLTDNKLAVKIADKNKILARMRTSLASLAESFSPPAVTRVPLMPGQRSA